MNKRIWIVIAGLATMSSVVQAQPVNTLDSLRTAYNAAAARIAADVQQQKNDALAQYGKTLDAILAALKQKGDIDGYAVFEQESKRFRDEKTVSTNIPHIYIADAVYAYRKQVLAANADLTRRMAGLLKQYVAALNGLVKDLMALDKIEDAKAARNVREEAESMLAGIESRLPKVEAQEVNPIDQKAVTNQPKTMLVRSKEYSIRGNEHKGTLIGRFKKGEKITLEYVSGRWSCTPRDPLSSPDEGPNVAQLCIGMGKTMSVLCEVPTGTKGDPFVYECGEDGFYSIRMRDDRFEDNSGMVRYRVTFPEGLR